MCRYCGRDLPTEPKTAEPRRPPSAQAGEIKPLNALRTLAILAGAGIAIFSIYGLIGGLDGTSRKTASVSEAPVQAEPGAIVSKSAVQAGPSAEASVPPVRVARAVPLAPIAPDRPPVAAAPGGALPAVAPRVALGPLVDALRAMPSVKVVTVPPAAPATGPASPAPIRVERLPLTLRSRRRARNRASGLSHQKLKPSWRRVIGACRSKLKSPNHHR